VQAIHEFQNDVLFTVSGVGVFQPHASDLVATGYLETGIYRWGIADTKFIPKYDIRMLPLDGTVSLAVKSDGGDYETFNALEAPDATSVTIDGFQDKIYEAEFKITLNRAATTSLGPNLTRFMARAYAAPTRSQIFQVPLVMQHRLNINGKDYWMDVDDELRLLRDLVDNARIISYQENQETFPVVVENVIMDIRHIVNAHLENDFEGTATVIMRSVR
jgi:hypothetical protein